MEKIKLANASALTSPNPVVLVCTEKEDGSTNLATVSWWTYLSFHPEMVAYAMSKKSFSGERVRETKKVVLAVPGKEIAGAVMGCGSSSGRDTDKAAKFGVDLQALPGTEIQVPVHSRVAIECDLKEFHEIYCAIQYHYTKDENRILRYVDGREDVILFTFREEEDGSITITDTRFAEEGEKAASSLEEMCMEIDAPYDEALDMLNFDRAYDVQDLIEYMDQHPDVTGIEYDGQVRTYEELKEIEDQRLRELYPEDFTES